MVAMDSIDERCKIYTLNLYIDCNSDNFGE